MVSCCSSELTRERGRRGSNLVIGWVEYGASLFPSVIELIESPERMNVLVPVSGAGSFDTHSTISNIIDVFAVLSNSQVRAMNNSSVKGVERRRRGRRRAIELQMTARGKKRVKKEKRLLVAYSLVAWSVWNNVNTQEMAIIALDKSSNLSTFRWELNARDQSAVAGGEQVALVVSSLSINLPCFVERDGLARVHSYCKSVQWWQDVSCEWLWWKRQQQ